MHSLREDFPQKISLRYSETGAGAPGCMSFCKRTLVQAFSKEDKRDFCLELLHSHVMRLHFSLHETAIQGLGTEAAALRDWQVPKMPIDGRALIQLGAPGSNVGTMLKKLSEKWCDSDFELTAEDLLHSASEMLQK